jgi:asparagine synthase (glutamine-hydrolysing)
MPGIFGLAANPSESDIAETLAAMADQMRHHPWYLEDRHIDLASGLGLGRISLGFLNTAEQPAFNEDRSLLAMMEGEVYDYTEHRRRLAKLGHQFRGNSQAELLLHGFEAQGRNFFRSLNGTFAAAIWDTRQRCLILVNDRFGMKPVYYAHRPGNFLLASEIKALLVEPDLSRAINPRGVAQFFNFGQLLGEDTLFDAIRILPAASWLTYDTREDRLSIDRYWRIEAGQGLNRLSESEALDRLDNAFQRAVDRRVEGTDRLGISLSGGLDARTILAVIDTDRTPITSVTLGMEGSLDHASSTRLAEIAGCSHHQYQLDRGFLDRFEGHLRDMVRLTDGHYLCQCIVMPSLPLYVNLGVEVLLRGHAGELMHMNKAYNYSLDPEFFPLRTDDELEGWLFNRLRAYMSGSEAGTLYSSPDGLPMEQLARESLRKTLHDSEGIEPPVHRISHHFLAQRLRRETALSMVEFGSVVETRLPYLDNDLVDALMAAPTSMKFGDRVQAHILRCRRPAFLDVINSNTGARIGAGSLERSLAQVRLKVLAKLGVRGYQPYERLGLWLRRELRPLVERVLLVDRCLGRGLLDPDTIRSVVKQHMNGQRNHTYLLLAMMIFEVGHCELFDDSPTPHCKV